MRGKRYKLTLRDLVLTRYLQEVSRGHSKLGYESKMLEKILNSRNIERSLKAVESATEAS